jgi:hypothetical protein
MSEDTRPLGLRMAYESMWSLLDDISSEDIERELERFKALQTSLHKERSAIDDKLWKIDQRRHVLEETLDNRYRARLRAEFKLTDEHRILVSLIWWDGMIPKFSFSYEELAQKLGWKLPNEYVSDEQTARLKTLIDEVPLALEVLTKYPEATE